MIQLLIHRGPDGEGYYCWPQSLPRVVLGMCRLSILDLETGDQPMFNEDRSIAVVFNGEIYNYIELRTSLERQGHVFQTRSDTETLVHLYEQYGLELFSHLRGMYAFAIWDSRKERLVLAVDHIGIKPLYLAERDGRLLFASEVKALFADPTLPRRLNLNTLDTYLTFGYMIGQDTLYEGIRRLQPGHALVVEGQRRQLVEHWRTHYSLPSERPTDERAIVAETRQRLLESVRLHLRSDVPLGLFLSGGIDSASILALMNKVGSGRVETFSVGYETGSTADPRDETARARQIARHFETEHHELIISADDWWRTLLDYVYHHDEPNANSSAVSLQALAKLTAQNVKVVLTGLGGDELFCGYPLHRSYRWLIHQTGWLDRIAQPDRRYAWVGKPWERAEALYPAMRRVRFVGALPGILARWQTLFMPLADGMRRMASFEGVVFSGWLRQSLYGPQLTEAWKRTHHKEHAYQEILQRAWTDDPGNVAQALVFNTWLPGNGLLSIDKVTMAHSLEARVPFFDPVLMNYAMQIPSSIQLRSSKFVLREALKGDLPDFVLQRSKRPFETPILRWFDDELSQRVREVLLDSRSLARGLFRQDALETLIMRHSRGATEQVEVIFRLLLLELWQRSTIDTEPRILDVDSPSLVAQHVA